MRGRAVLLAAVLLVGGCAGDPAAPEVAPEVTPTTDAEVPLPATLTAYVDQSRVARVGRSVFVRLINDGDVPVTVTRAEVSSDRFGEAVWSGEEEVVNEGDLEFELPVGRCGTGSDASVRLSYRLGDGPELVSTTIATDRYGAVGLFLDRDCAEETMTEAADVEVGAQRVAGVGRSSYFELPVTLAATGARPDVGFAGFEGTVLFRPIDPTPVFGSTAELPLTTGVAEEVRLRLVPTRCDPHALAEDKVGTLVGVHVTAPGLAEGSSYYLPISDEARAALRRFFATHCGL